MKSPPPLPDLPALVTPIIDAAVRVVRAAAPRAEEVACASQRPRSKSMMWKLLRYRIDDKVVVTIGTFTKHASMFFARGSELDDPSGVLEGTGEHLRYVTLRAPADATRAALKALLRQAFALERASSGDWWPLKPSFIAELGEKLGVKVNILYDRV